MSDETVKCKQCKTTIDALAVFPGGICLKCHAAKWDAAPLDQMPRPDFTKVLNTGRRRR